MPFKPGQSGNPSGGQKREKPFRDALMLAIKEAYEDGGTALRDVATALVTKARTGDIPAIKEVADRIDGKVPQGIIGGDEGDNPVNHVHRIERIIVDPANRDG